MIFVILFLTGIVAGFLNTLAGGGSVLTLPVLIMAGLPSPVANATNRVAILLQNITATSRFKAHGALVVKPVIHITIAAVLGAVLGSLFAVKISSALFDKILGVVFIIILIMVIRPKSKQTPMKLPRWLECIIFFGVGMYGGFIQAGVGFIFLATLALVERQNLVQANAIKVFIVMCYTLFAVVIFALAGKILWVHGFVLAAGTILGAWLGVHSAIKKGESLVRIVLVVAVLIACAKLFGLLALIGV
jgi:uncharacterized membrane protein YfcA